MKKAAERLAREDGVSLNQWIASAVAQMVGVVETTAEFFGRRRGKATGKKFGAYLTWARRRAPEPHDRLT
jgi:hypothetical protein